MTITMRGCVACLLQPRKIEYEAIPKREHSHCLPCGCIFPYSIYSMMTTIDQNLQDSRGALELRRGDFQDGSDLKRAILHKVLFWISDDLVWCI